MAYGVSTSNSVSRTLINYSGPGLQYNDYVTGTLIGGDNWVRPLNLTDTRLAGAHLSHTCASIDAWAVDKDDPYSPVQIEVWADAEKGYGRYITTGTAGRLDWNVSRRINECQTAANGDPSVDCSVCSGADAGNYPQCIHLMQLLPGDFPGLLDGGTHTVYLYAIKNGNSSLFAHLNPDRSVTCGRVDPAWWQVTGGDVTSGQNLKSTLPSGQTFITNGSGGSAGVASYTSTTSLNTSNVSSQKYIAKTEAQPSDTYSYKYFSDKIPSDVTLTEITSNSVNGGFFDSGGTPARGYVWYHYNGSSGDLTINNVNMVGDRKVVLLVDGANLNLKGTIKIQNAGRGFFMAVVGKTAGGGKGDIVIDPSVGGNPTAIEGVFFAEDKIVTGGAEKQLKLRGSWVGLSGIDLQRNLGNSNSTTPAETFEFAPELIALYPNIFTTKKFRWQEVAP